MIKRGFDFLISGLGLLAASPLLAVIALAIRRDSRGPVFFRQERVGRGGRVFRIHKFRTMYTDAERCGTQITVGRDPRITRVGETLRRYKLDELPQLWDVLRGEMSLVGPRPEVPRYVALYPDRVREVVLSVRPGITDPASLEFYDESALLGRQADPETYYREQLLPRKLEIYERYARQHGLASDLRIVLATIARVFRG